MFRAYRVKETGQWCGPLMEDVEFFDDGLERADRVAATLGLGPGSLEVVDNETDPRTGDLLMDTTTVTTPPRESLRLTDDEVLALKRLIAGR